RHAAYVAASRARDETRLVVDRSQIEALLSSRLPLDRTQQAEPASAEDRRAQLAGRLSSGHTKTSTIAVIEQAALPVKHADRLHSRPSADRAMQPPTKPPAAQEAARAAPRSSARTPDRGLEYGR
ncbi:MAG TPA: exonuclease V subunit alpha, partial [Gammaproteobacteria bacterium]|nr:exonuclease V subunit alpha [Gammaproteobacteria bacterium]